MKGTLFFLGTLLAVLGVAASLSGAGTSMAAAARSFLSSLGAARGTQASLPFAGDELRSWHPRKLSSGALMPWSVTGL